MGCQPSKPRVSNRDYEPKTGTIEHSESDCSEDDEPNEELMRTKQDQVLKSMQEHNLKRMKEELKSDVHMFVLNNLLMCVQLFDNFDKSLEAAKVFKREKESEITEILAEGPQDGQILGDRRCFLTHGMGHILAKNYIYRPSDNFIEDDLYARRSDAATSTFMCEGILPLEFTMSWDNLEVHDHNQWDTLNDAPYESASGTPSVIRCCMEEPDEKNKVPKGYVRLRCLDVPISLRPQLSLLHVPNSDADQGYMYDYSEFNDKASEVQSDSEELPETDSSDQSDGIQDNFMNDFKNRIERNNNNYQQPNYQRSSKLNKYDFRKKTPQIDSTERHRRDSGIVPFRYPREPLRNLNSDIVTINVNPSTPQIQEEEEEQAFAFPGMGKPNTGNNIYLNPTASIDRWSRSAQNSTNGQQKPRDPQSSGYETGSQTSAASRASSLVSEEVRDRWRNVEIKFLWNYEPKNRRKNMDRDSKPEPLSSGCFMSVKYEIESDDDDVEEDEDEESDDSDEQSKIIKDVKMETRTYLNSSNFSADYCSEFHYIAERHGIPVEAVAHAVVMGTTIRCAVSCRSDTLHKPDSNDDDDGSEVYHMLYTFTPATQCKSWPRSALFSFNRRMKATKKDGTEAWPSYKQVDEIEALGCSAIPLGYRSIEFFNKHQGIEWQINLGHAENLLLNSLMHVQWRTYTFTALLFRAFIAPLGPQGVGLEHIRNILYFMCHEDFIGWNDEEPGLHVKALLSKLFGCLGKGKMPSFFISNRNLLKSIPPQNARLVQAHLSRVRDNLLIYFIYAFRNLTCIRPTKNYYPFPKFQDLYKILITKHEELLVLVSPLLDSTINYEQDEAKKKEVRKKNKKRDAKRRQELLLDQGNAVDGEFNQMYNNNKTTKPDKNRQSNLKKYDKFLKEEKQRKAVKRQLRQANKSSKEILPETERRKSIDLDQLPVVSTKFNSFRLALIIKFFIKHFLEMARQSQEFRAYNQATMYVLQVENLCKILQDSQHINLAASSIERADVEDYEKEAQDMRDVIGTDNMRTYVTSRYSHLFGRPTTTTTSDSIIGESFRSNLGPTSSNFVLMRKLPTPPESTKDEIIEATEEVDTTPSKKFEAPQFHKSFQSIPSVSRKPARKESIKFMDKPIIIKPKSLSRSTSQEPYTIEENPHESTDL